MKQKNCDILIIGSGLVGSITAYALSLLGLTIILVDKKKLSQKYSTISNYNQKDTRTTAIAEGSKEFLKEIKLWKFLSKFSQPIKQIKVIDRKLTNNIDFSNQKLKKNLGYIIKNNDFLSTLIHRIKQTKNISLIDQADLKSISYGAEKVICKFDKFVIYADLLVAADGKNSFVRNLKNTQLYKKSYKENAFVVNFEHSTNHNSCAYEFFYRNGPLAVLPMKKEKKFQSCLIWSNNKNFLENLLISEDKFICNLLEEKISNYFGSITKIKSKQIFPLSAHINNKFYEERLIYIGDSAHSVHPIAGQGWNLGLRDVSRLYKNIIKFQNLGLEIGTKQFCNKYHQMCFYDAYRLYQITDKLNYVFKSENFILNSFRSIGFDYIQKNNIIKNKISKFAMGF